MKSSILFFLLIWITSWGLQAQQGGYALKFSNSDHGVNCGNSSSLQINGVNITLEAWVYPTSFGETYGWENSIIEKLVDQFPVCYGYVLRCGVNGRVEMYFGSASQSWFGLTSSDGVLVTNKWQHVAGTYDGANIRIFVNGKQVASVAETKAFSSTSSSFLCIGNNQDIAFHRPFSGYLDEIRIWNSTRTPEEIRAYMSREVSTSTNLKAYYKMTDGTGTSLTDNSGNGNTGTLVGTPSWAISGCFSGSGKALSFDGVNEKVTFSASNAPTGNSNYTIEAWIKPSRHLYDGIIGWGSWGTTNTCNAIRLHFDGTSYGIFNYWWNNDLYYPTGNLTGKWSHIAFSFDGTNRKFYLNGKLMISSPAYNHNVSTNSNLTIGRTNSSDSECFQGEIDEVRIWNFAVDGSTIRENMMKSLAGNETGLVSYYRFDHLDGTVLYDMTANGFNGTLTNMEASTDWVTSNAYNTWLGGQSTAWATSGNWSNGTPTSIQSTGLYKWNLANITTYESTISGSPTVNNLLVPSSSNPVLSSDLTVTGNLLLERDMGLGGNTITIGPSGTLDEGSGHFSGSTGMIVTTRELTNLDAVNVGGLGAILTTPADLGQTTITRRHANQENAPNGRSILRSYDINPTINEGLNATIDFTYLTTELNSITEPALALYRSEDDGLTFTYFGGTVDTENNFITLTGVEHFSLWTASEECLNPASAGVIDTAQTICYTPPRQN